MTSPLKEPHAAARLALNEVEMAAALGVSVSWLQHDRCHRRLVPFYRLGGNIRYNPHRVTDALSLMEEGGTRAMKRVEGTKL